MKKEANKGILNGPIRETSVNLKFWRHIMRQKKSRTIISYIALAVMVLSLKACVGKAPVGESDDVTMSRKDELFEIAFSAMQAKADELGIEGVAMAALLEDTSTLDWKIAALIMGKVEYPHGEKPGWNIIAMVGSKIGETILTHAPSGHCPRPLMHGEVGFANAEGQLNGEGAEFIDLGGAYCVCAFGGGPHEQDYIVGCAGAQAIKKAYRR